MSEPSPIEAPIEAVDLDHLASLTPEQLDALPFGVIQVDDTGVVKLYNRYESQLSGIAAAAVIGRHFFTQIAPCTNNRLLYGRFRDGVVAGQFDATIPYTFTYKLRPTNVFIRLVRHTPSGTNWILVKRR